MKDLIAIVCDLLMLLGMLVALWAVMVLFSGGGA